MKVLMFAGVIRKLSTRLPYVIAAGAFAFLLPAFLFLYHHHLYSVSTASHKLLTKASINTAKVKVTDEAVTYNEAQTKPKAGEGDIAVGGEAGLAAKLASAKSLTIAGPTDASAPDYQATIHKDFSEGLKFGDAKGDLSFTMKPLFGAREGEYSKGHILFPVSTNTRVFQTFKKNGIKEDIVLSKSPRSGEADYAWRLELGSKLKAKLLPDGSVGIFSANPNLYGNLQAGDAKSQALVDKARINDKSYQMFTIPAPYIKDAKGTIITKGLKFSLKDNVLTLTATNLKDHHYPLSIDPSVVITTTADFATGTDDGMIDYATANQIGRGTVTLGSVGSTTQQTAMFTPARHDHASVAYNGYLYIIGGTTGTRQNDIIRCPLDPGTGAAGTCVQQTSAFTTARFDHTSVVYNGYLYIIGGSGGSLQNDIQRCPLDPSTGAAGTCVQQTSAFTGARYRHTSVVYNGYLYIIGGDASGNQNDIQRCPINGDGSVGTCVQQTSAFTTARDGHTSVAYNGYLYIIGGFSGAELNDIQRCPINGDGSVGTCVQQTSAFTTARNSHTSVAYNGHLYIIGGSNGTTQNDIQRCPINGDGSVGTCVQQTSAFTTARQSHTSVAYNGYLYIVGGCSDGFCSTNQNDIQRLPFSTAAASAAGAVGTTTQQTNAFTTTRRSHTSVAYNGYLYIIGGYDGNNYLNDIIHCPLDPSTGAAGTCIQQTNAFTTTRQSPTSVAYNGYLYIIGGQDIGGFLNDIIRCPTSSDGSVGTCVQQTNAFALGRAGHTSVAYNGYLYLIGGNEGSYQNDIIRCPLDPGSGAAGTCVQQTSAFTTARIGHTSVAYNGYLYIIGGDSGSAQNDIQRCAISPSDGSVTTPCTQQTNAFTTARNAHTSVAYNGYVYIIGGSGGSLQNDIQRCPLDPSTGAAGTCTQQTSAFTTAREHHKSVVYNGYLYIIGGWSGSYQNDIQRLLISSMDQAAHYERVVDIGRVVDSVDSIQYNGTAKCGAKVQYATAGSDGIFGSLTTFKPDAISGVTYSLSGETLKRYVRVVITLTDQQCGGTSTVTDLTVNYTLLPPDPPTLSNPASGAVDVSLTPLLQFRTTDALDSYAQYKILLYQSDCSTLIRTIDQTSSQTGWSGQNAQTSTAYNVSSNINSSTIASHVYQAPALSYNNTYCWKVAAIDPGGSNTFGSYSATQLFSTNQTPSAPTLTQPAAAQTGVSTTPEFRFYSTDVDSDPLKYKIEICSTSNCSSVVRTVIQVDDQTGWLSQSLNGGATYSSGQTAIHVYQSPALSANTQYWWRAYAIDTFGVNAYSSPSSIGTFTTQTTATPLNVKIKGNVNIGGGVIIKP